MSSISLEAYFSWMLSLSSTHWKTMSYEKKGRKSLKIEKKFVEEGNGNSGKITWMGKKVQNSAKRRM